MLEDAVGAGIHLKGMWKDTAPILPYIQIQCTEYSTRTTVRQQGKIRSIKITSIKSYAYEYIFAVVSLCIFFVCLFHT